MSFENICSSISPVLWVRILCLPWCDLGVKLSALERQAMKAFNRHATDKERAEIVAYHMGGH